MSYVLLFRPFVSRIPIYSKIRLQDTLLAQPLALKEIANAKKEAKKGKASGFESLRLRAGQTLPGGTRSTMHLAQGVLGRDRPSRFQWGARQKLGIDKTSVWAQL